MLFVRSWKYGCYCCSYKNLHLSKRIRKGESVLLLKSEMEFVLPKSYICENVFFNKHFFGEFSMSS